MSDTIAINRFKLFSKIVTKLPLLQDHVDLETNHPNKLFRDITDLFDELESERGYGSRIIEEPKLKETPLSDIANFKGQIEVTKTFSSYHKGRIIGGIIVAAIGAILTGITQMDLNRFVNLNFDSSIIFFVGIGLIIIGAIMALIQAKTKLNIGAYLTGESYKYKGHQQTMGTESEKRERLDVVSDVRITVKGYPSKNSYFKPEFKEILNDDLDFIFSKVKKIVPKYRVPSST